MSDIQEMLQDEETLAAPGEPGGLRIAAADRDDAASSAAAALPEDLDAEDQDSQANEAGVDAATVEAEDSNGEIRTEQVVEALLFASDRPLTLPKLVALLGVGSARDVRTHIEKLNKQYEKNRAPYRIQKLAGGYQMLTLPAFNTWIRRLRESKQESKLSQAAMETLAVVAYKQPVVRADIEAIRGVASGEMLNRLRELGLVKIVGRAEDVGRPMLYGTTRKFLEVFGLAALDELPQVEELKAPS